MARMIPATAMLTGRGRVVTVSRQSSQLRVFL